MDPVIHVLQELGALRADMHHVRGDLAEIKEMAKSTGGRVSSLERSRTTVLGWVAGAVAVAGALWAFVGLYLG